MELVWYQSMQRTIQIWSTGIVYIETFSDHCLRTQWLTGRAIDPRCAHSATIKVGAQADNSPGELKTYFRVGFAQFRKGNPNAYSTYTPGIATRELPLFTNLSWTGLNFGLLFHNSASNDVVLAVKIDYQW